MQISRTVKLFAALAILFLASLAALKFFEAEKIKPIHPPTAPSQVQDSRNPRERATGSMASDTFKATNESEEIEAAGPKLPLEKVEEYLTRNNRSAASLIAAFHSSGDTNYLAEAARNFPNDPQVNWTVLARQDFPEERRKWLDLFKASSPNNSLANYLSAADYFKSGNTELAMKEMTEATQRNQFRDYALEAKLNEEELNRSAGLPPLAASMTAGWASDLLPELAQLKALARAVSDARTPYLTSGDTDSFNALTQMQLALGRRLTGDEGGKMAISQLVGNAIEAMTLQPLDQNAPYDFLNGKTPAERLAQMKEQKQEWRDLTKSFFTALPNMTESEHIAFSDRWKAYGELEAMRWAQQRFGKNPNSQ